MTVFTIDEQCGIVQFQRGILHCGRELAAGTASVLPTHRWIKMICGSYSAFCKWLPNEIPLWAVILKIGPEDSGFLNWKKLPKYLILTTYLLVSLLSQFIWGHYRFKSVYQLVVDSFVKYTLKLESLSKLVLAHLLCTGTLLIRTYPLVPSPLL